MKTTKLLPYIFLLLTTTSYAQYYPQQQFQAPLDTPLYLSAPFGSLRDNHFHSGMDIRTNEVEGLPVYAIADGYVSRIKIQSVGYGKAIYIRHPNGYTSEYGHLQKYSGAIASYISSYQYKNEQFEIDHFPSGNALKVSKGQIIGYSGNSGTSTGPHLHFEIRDSRTEEIINPLLFGIPVKDSLPPVIKKIIVYDLNQQSPQKWAEYELASSRLYKTDSGYIYSDTLFVAVGLSGFGLIASDYLMSPEKEYSLYEMEYSIDSKKYFKFQLNRFPFDRSRCVNVHIDYAFYKKEGIRIQKLFLDDGNTIPLYSFVRNKGKFQLHDQMTHQVKFTVGDFSGKIFVCYAMVKTGPDHAPLLSTENCSSPIIYPTKDNLYQKDNIFLLIPDHALYDTTNLCIETLSGSKNFYAPVYRINDYTLPLNKNITLSIKPENRIKPEWQEKLCLAYAYAENAPYRYCSSSFENGLVTGKYNQFGFYTLKLDTTAPVLRFDSPPQVKWLNDTTPIKVFAEDDFSGLAAYSGMLNGRWILLEYDAKNNLLTYSPDGVLTEEMKKQIPLVFSVQVADKRGNRSEKKMMLTTE